MNNWQVARYKRDLPWELVLAGMLSLCLVALLTVVALIGWQGVNYFWPSTLYQFEVKTSLGQQVFYGELYARKEVASQQLIDTNIRLANNKATQQRLLINIGNSEEGRSDFINVLQQDVLAKSTPPNLMVIEQVIGGDLFVMATHPVASDLLTGASPNQVLTVQDSQGRTLAIPLSNILRFWFPNQMNSVEKIQHWFSQVFDFVTNSSAKSTPEGGIFPAIFGTILMVLIMSVMVMPLGVLAAVYLHEYAQKNAFTRVIRLAVVNLATVPSIVYGVFGLGFFVYGLGGSIDKFFYQTELPNPTFGTPGLLWSSLTLGLLTLPVVIVSTEEGLKRIPSSIRYAALSLGATRAEMLRTIVLPMASPAMMTGLIFAIARAAGEVAPLMLVGVVKLAQSLPLDAEFPFLHLDRKFMHLGYHIYDLSMRSANLEAMKPLVYATTLLLVLVVIGLNLTAIMIRNHLREKYQMLESLN